MEDLDAKFGIVDEKPPFNVYLSAHYKKCFAYPTIRDRLPIILTKIIDALTRDKDEITVATNAESSRDDIKDVIGNLSKFKYEIQTDKPMTPFEGNEKDPQQWNEFFERMDEKNSYFSANWLHVECYIYRRFAAIFDESPSLNDFDYFRKQKENALISNMPPMISILHYISEQEANIVDHGTKRDLGQFFKHLLKLNLWGNKCDLSLSAGVEVQQSSNPFESIDSLDQDILVNRCNEIWECLSNGSATSIVDVVLDNSGYELFTDLILADFILTNKLAGKIRFHMKAIPWFISDVRRRDFEWTIEQFQRHDNRELSVFGSRLANYIESETIILMPDEYFWTGPWEYHYMKSMNKSLYDLLAEAHLIIFKGDLNYRKLMGDFNTPYTTPFVTVLRDFRPTNLCALRTVKADVVSELKEGVFEEISKDEPNWMETGKYGLIQFAPKI